MTEMLSLIARHGYAFTFGLLFAEAMGLPLPAAVALVAGGAAVASHALGGPLLLTIAVTALLLGDSVQFFLGRYMGWALLGFLCRVSINPETCILRSAESFYKRGKATLVIAKFIPGINTMAAPLAGSMKMRLRTVSAAGFGRGLVLCVDLCGRRLSLAGLSGRSAARLSHRRASHGSGGRSGAGGVCHLPHRAIPQASRVSRRTADPGSRTGRSAWRRRTADRVHIVDVRSHGYYDRGAERIKDSIRIEPNNLEEEIKNLPKDKDIYLYCT